MRVITCSDCGRPVSDTERTCPYCGCPVNISINNMLKEKRKQQSQQNSQRNSSNYINSNSKATQNSRFDLQMGTVSSGRKSSTAVKTRTKSSRKAKARAAQKRRKRRLLFVAILIILLLVLMIFGITKCASKPNNFAQAVYDGNGHVFYANDKDDGRLYKATLDGDTMTKEQKLSEYSPSELIMDGEWLYFTNSNRDNMIYRINSRGLDESLVYESGAKNLEIVDGWLIFDNKDANYDQYMIKIADIKTGEVAEAVANDGSSASSNKTQDDQDNSTSDSQNSSESAPPADLSAYPSDMRVKNSKLPWNLVLANKNNVLSTDYDSDIETSTLQNGKKVDKRIKTKLNDMLAAMEADLGECYIFVSSSYRTVATQQALFERKVESLVTSGMTQEEAEIKAVETVSKAGTSDHNTGLSFDFNDGFASFADTREYEWLKENAYKYGFIERYPQSGESKTMSNWEPYHYRYVGNEAAQIIHDEGITLEEYIFKYYNDCVVTED